MKRLIWTTVCCLYLLSGGCVKDPELGPAEIGEGEAWATLDFGHTEFDEVHVTTRSTLGLIAESRVTNLYVFLFDGSGNRVYGHYFDSGNRLTSRDEVVTANLNCWSVENLSDESGAGETSGTIRMKVPKLIGGELCIVANLDTDMFNISPEQFSFIQTRDELMGLTAVLNQEITSRNGMFPMTGSVQGITVSDDGITSPTNETVKIPLTRFDAKIEVRVRTATGNEASVEHQGSTTLQRIKGFTPGSWRVVNLPKGSYLFEHDAEGGGGYDAGAGFFDSSAVNFEEMSEESFIYTNDAGESVETTSPVHSFSFYMYENRPAAKKTVSKYHQRDKRNKDASGAYDTTNGLWEYAPESGTYLVIEGEVAMDVNVEADAKEQTLNAMVTYYIHLGDIADDLNDYKVKRNTHYTYTITIKGVEDIQVEVLTNEERQSGATGEVYIAKESIYTFDAHFGQRVFAFDEAFIQPNSVTWYVKTPFGREGIPERINGVEVPNGLDYKWVSFRINDLDATGRYSHRNSTYHPDRVMDVLEFSEYIREQKIRFDNGRTNDFREEEDPDLKARYPDNPEIYRRNRIYVTIFVDEFYYDSDPISGEVRPALWKEFVNQPNRTMHILCDTQFSADGESSVTGSVVTIRQRSIQSVFDITNAGLNTAWGCETTDETEGRLWFYDRNETHGYMPERPYEGNTSRSNGLYNTARLWGFTDGYGNFYSEPWTNYLDFDRENDDELLFLKDDDQLATARYTCLMRNRDENGDGIIDASEIKWYMASIQQLTALYMGDQGLSSDAQLYDRYNGYGKDEKNDLGSLMWRRHIISSTRWGGTSQANYPTMMWTEEGLSTSAYQQYSGVSTGNKPGRYAVRCVRNLGMDPASEAEAVKALNDIDRTPDFSILFQEVQESNDVNSVYRFDVSRINKKSSRYYTSRELEPGNEYSESARLYSAFETGPLVSYPGDYLAMEEEIERGESPCPEGFRVPNIREASLMSNYITSEVNSNWWSGYILINSSYSFGVLGKNYDSGSPDAEAPGDSWSWYCTGGHITIAPQGNYTIRCVRDVEVE